MMYNILCFDEAGITGIEISEMLSKYSINVIIAKNSADIFKALNEFNLSAMIFVINSEFYKELDYLKELKHSKEYKSTPVIAISKFPDRKCIIKAIESGAHEFIAMPYNNEILINKVCSILGIIKPLDNELIEDLIDEDVIIFSFSEMFNKEIKAASRGDYPVSLMIACVERKLNNIVKSSSINEVTDNLLKVVKTKVRDTDTVFKYRKNGLALLLPFADKQGAAIVDDKIMNAFENHTLLKDYNSEFKLVTSSVSFPEDGKVQKRLLDKVESGLVN